MAVAALTAAVAAWAFHQLPSGARIPIHWNAAGKADGYGGPATLFLLPATIAGLSLLLYFVTKIEPRRIHLHRSARAYCWVWLTLVAFLAGLHALAVQAALGRAVSMDRWVTGGVGLLFLVIGNFLGKIRSNFMFGVRTPWTLSSDLAWNRTHRLAGWLFVAGGAALLTAVAAGIVGRPLSVLLIGWIIVTGLICTAYSYWVWRSDPNRREASLVGGGTQIPH